MLEVFTGECIDSLDHFIIMCIAFSKKIFMNTLKYLQTHEYLLDVDLWRLFANLEELSQYHARALLCDPEKMVQAFPENQLFPAAASSPARASAQRQGKGGKAAIFPKDFTVDQCTFAMAQMCQKAWMWNDPRKEK
ncbi:pleckstrin homology [Lynx pardinus]|uniref:Pleckstrin homology n=1 Tax=Lynx pardinus TaxID=191816 RepID=A0A485NE22_LYNPA|nr:pleckstrin homology [Lynx pardinus]